MSKSWGNSSFIWLYGTYIIYVLANRLDDEVETSLWSKLCEI